MNTYPKKDVRQALYRVLESDGSFEEKTREALELGKTYLNVDDAYLAYIDTDSKTWESVVCASSTAERVLPAALNLETTYCRRTIERESPVTIHDAQSQNATDDPAYQAHGIACYHGTTLVVGDEPYGTVSFVATEPRSEAFSDEETMFVELLTHLLEREIRRHRQEAEITRQQNIRTVLNRVLRHNLRNSITVIRGQIQQFVDERETDADVEGILERIDDIHEVAKQARELDEVVDKRFERREMDIAELLERLVTKTEQSYPSASIAVSVRSDDDNETTAAIRPSFERALQELIDNAAKHSDDPPTVSVTATLSSETLDIRVIDDGPGLPDSEVNVLETGKETPLIHGSGLGLWLVHLIVADHDGMIETSVTADETMITITVPRSEATPRSAGSEGMTETVEQPLDRYRAAFERAFDAILLVNDDRRIIDANETAGQLYGASQQQLLGRSLEEIFTEEYDSESEWQDFKTAGERQNTAPITTLDGENRYIEYAATTDITPGQHLVIARDVTERRECQQELHETKRRLSLALQSGDSGVWEWNVETDEIRWNDSMERLVGLEPGEFDGTYAAFTDHVHPADLSAVEETIERTLKNEGDYQVQYRTEKANGEQIWLDVRGELVAEDGQTKLIGVSTDITEQKEYERALELAETFFEHNQDGTFVADVGDDEYTIKRVNPAYEDQSDVAAGTIEGKTPREIVGDEQGAEVEAHYRECIERREPVEYEEDLVFDDRETHWWTKIAPVVIDGTVEYIVGSTREITERKEREARIETLKERLELAVEGANLGIWDWDMRTDDVEFNETWATMLGYTPEELDSCFEVWEQRVHPDDLDDVKKALSRHVEEQSPHYDVEHRLRTATDDWKWIRTVGKVAERDGEEPVRAVGIHIDIDDRRRHEQELKRSQRRLDQTQTVANVGGWEVDLQTEAVTWTDEMYQIHGVNHDFEPTIEKVLDFYISEDREKVRTAIEQAADGGDSFDIEARIATLGGDIRRVRTHCEPVFEDDAVVKVVGAQQDITDQYEKRARILRELHAATQELYPIRSESDVIAYLDSFLEQAFEFDHTCVMRFDDDTGSLRPQSVSSTLTDDASILGEVLPSDHPVWRAFQHDESVTSEDVAIQAEAFEDGTHNQLLAVPIGEFGVAVAINAGRTPFDQVDTELVEVAAANAKSASDSLWSARARSELNEKFSTKQDTIDSLRDMIETTQSLQQMFGNGVTKAEIETNTCDELLGLDPIDFVWIGRPRDGTTALSPTEWAGDGSEYLDSVGSENQTELPPSERAAAQREPIAVSDVPSRVKREEWAKTALSADFRSILSIPLVYDDVLYGVLTVCARETDAFGQSLETFLRIVGSFLVNRNRMLELRTGESEWLTELEVTGEWATYPVQRLAATTESRIRYETVIERDPETVRILVTVEDGDPATVHDAATDISDILAANRLGNEGQNRLTLTCQRPFLSSVVEQHGGRMADAVSTPSETTCRVHVRMSASTRPIVESLHSRYEDVDVVSQKQQPRSFVGEDTDVEDRLTDRQREILETAYHAGFFETPRDVTLEEIADNFDISKPAVYNHLQAAYRTVFESIFEADTPVR